MNEFRLEEALVAAATIFSAETVAETKFKLKAFKVLLSHEIGDPDDGTLDVYEILDAVEKYAGYWNEDKIRHLVSTLGLLEPVQGHDELYVRKREITLEEVSRELIKGKPSIVEVDFIDQIRDHENSDPLVTLFEISEVASKAYRNVPLFFDLPDWRMPAPFMQRAQDQRLTSFTANRSITAAFDQVALLIEAPDFMPAFADTLRVELKESLLNGMVSSLKQTLLSGESYGDEGGVHLAGKDEDYPGGDRPAVPSNAIALIGLSLHILTSDASEELIAIARGIAKFLVSHQLRNGLWGVYSYERDAFPGEFQSDPQIFFSSLSVTALNLHVVSDSGTNKEIIVGAIQRCAAALLKDSDLDVCSINSSGKAGADGVAATTAYAMNILTTAFGRLDDGLQSLARSRISQFGEWITENWDLSDEGRVDEVRFRPPTTDGPAGTFMTWEQPAHAQILSCMCTATLKDLFPLDRTLAQKMHQAASRIVLESNDGFWMDFGMTDKIQVSNSATCAMSLLRYLALQRARLDSM